MNKTKRDQLVNQVHNSAQSCFDRDANHSIDDDLPGYLVAMILPLIRDLERVCPDHLLVKAVKSAMQREVDQLKNQLSLPL